MEYMHYTLRKGKLIARYMFFTSYFFATVHAVYFKVDLILQDTIFFKLSAHRGPSSLSLASKLIFCLPSVALPLDSPTQDLQKEKTKEVGDNSNPHFMMQTLRPTFYHQNQIPNTQRQKQAEGEEGPEEEGGLEAEERPTLAIVKGIQNGSHHQELGKCGGQADLDAHKEDQQERREKKIDL